LICGGPAVCLRPPGDAVDALPLDQFAVSGLRLQTESLHPLLLPVLGGGMPPERHECRIVVFCPGGDLVEAS
jgi:hypothetical protein